MYLCEALLSEVLLCPMSDPRTKVVHLVDVHQLVMLFAEKLT
jgi:hypothetical protein